VCILRGANGQRYLQEARVVKSPRHQLDEFVVITLADLFELSVPNVRIQVQSDLRSRKFFLFEISVAQPS
jgi:hypothetical protein